MKKYLTLVILVIVLLGANIITASANPNGQPFQALWDAIAYLQEQIDNIELLPGPEGPQGEQGLQGEQGSQGESGTSLHLYDANGLDLGILMSIDNPSNANRFTSYLSDPGVFLEFEQNAFERTIGMHNIGSPLYFSSDNCIGDPYSPTGGNPGATVVSHTGRVFKFTDQPLVQGNNSWSQLAQQCANGQGVSQLYYPLEEVSLPFSLPPAWPLEIY